MRDVEEDIWESSKVYLLKLGASEQLITGGKSREKMQLIKKNSLCDLVSEKNKVAAFHGLPSLNY